MIAVVGKDVTVTLQLDHELAKGEQQQAIEAATARAKEALVPLDPTKMVLDEAYVIDSQTIGCRFTL